MVKQAYDNFKFQENIQQIIGHVQMFSKEFEKFNEEFSKVGERITSLEDQYNKVNGTRMNQLRKRMEKVQLESGTDTDDQIKLLD